MEKVTKHSSVNFLIKQSLISFGYPPAWTIDLDAMDAKLSP